MPRHEEDEDNKGGGAGRRHGKEEGDEGHGKPGHKHGGKEGGHGKHGGRHGGGDCGSDEDGDDDDDDDDDEAGALEEKYPGRKDAGKAAAKEWRKKTGVKGKIADMDDEQKKGIRVAKRQAKRIFERACDKAAEEA